MNNSTSLHELIQLYFAGETTLQQERKLRNLLAKSNDCSPEAEEARALLSYFAVAGSMQATTPRPVAKPAKRKLLTPMRIASAVACAIALPIVCTMIWSDSAGLSTPMDNGNLSYAHIKGVATNDASRIDDMILSQLSEINDVVGSVDQSFDEDIINMSTLLNQQ